MANASLPVDLNGSSISLSAPFQEIPITSPPSPSTSPAAQHAKGFGPDGTLADIKKAHRTSASISRMVGLGSGSRDPSPQGSSSRQDPRATLETSHASSSSSLQPSTTQNPANGLPTPSPPPPPPPLPRTNGNGEGASHSSASHRPSLAGQGSASALEKVLSKTRPNHLPPKDREEDQKHLRDWEKMMTESKEHDKIRTSTLVQSQSNLAATHAHHLPFWRETLLQNPSAALLNPEHAHVPTPSPQDRERRQLRDVFWDGIPSIWRAEVWLKLVGNGLALGSRDYDGYVGRFEKAVQEKRFPKSTMEDIERDAERCWTGLGMYERGSDRWKVLREFLGAWVVARSDEGLGYQTGFHLLAATALLNMTPHQAWLFLRNLMAKSGVLRAFYDPRRAGERQAYYRVLETLCSDPLPKVYYNLLSNSIQVPDSWFLTFFVEQLSLPVACRVWDQLLLEGDGFIFKTCIAILQTLSYRLYDPDPAALRSVLAGTAPVVLPTARAGASETEVKVEEGLWRAGGGRIYGIEEGRFFGFLREGEREWKEGAFGRLVQRELDSAM